MEYPAISPMVSVSVLVASAVTLISVELCSTSCRVARGSYPPPAPTEPDLWASHPALRDIGVGELNRLNRCQPCGPQLFQRECQLRWSDDAMHLTVPVLKREEPPVHEIPLVESVVHRAAMTERPQGLTALVDDAPCGARPSLTCVSSRAINR
jgi:hypothetical protein